MSNSNGYRLLDEMEDRDVSRRRLPWSPLWIFVLTIFIAPAGALFSGINWARLNRPERRGPAFAAALIALVIPFSAAAGAQWFNVTLDRAYWRPAMTLLSFAIAYWQLFEQRPVFDAYLARGGQAASNRTLWLFGILVILFFVFAMFVRSSR